MTYSILGMHLPNGPMDIDRWVDLVGDGTYTLLHAEASCLKRLRERAPRAMVLVRCYLPNWYAVDPTWWAGECARIYAGVKGYTTHITWANEQNLAVESGGAIGATPSRRATRRDYEVIHDWNLRWLAAWRTKPGTDDAILHYPAFASGHSDDQDDDGFVGLDICRAGIDQCPVLDRHIYFTSGVPVGDPWLGIGRIDLTRRLFPGKPIFISESGNFAVTDPRSPDQYAAAFYAAQARPEVIGWTPFIADSLDRGHDANNLSRNRAILDALARTTRVPRPDWTPPKEPPVSDIALSVPTRISLARPENYAPGPRARTIGVVIHTTRGGGRPENEFSSTIAWFQNPDAGVSAHLIVGHSPFDEVARCVPDDDIAWHARAANATHLGIEICQAKPTDPITDFQYRAAAEACQLWAVKYGFPLRRVKSQLLPGIVGHEDAEAGKQDGKTDPGPMFDWDRFIALCTGGTVTDPKPPAPAFNLRAELDGIWAAAERLEKAGYSWTGQGLKALVAVRKGEK